MKSNPSSLKPILLTLFIVLLFFDLSGQDNKGNPLPHFLFPSFKEGRAIMKEGKNFSTLLNYNMVDEKMRDLGVRERKWLRDRKKKEKRVLNFEKGVLFIVTRQKIRK